MLQAATHLGNTQSTARSGVSQVNEELALLRGTWTGDASAAFDRSMAAWLADCQVIIQKLGEMIEVMNGNRQVITAGEASNTEAAAGIPVGPGLQGL
jgi:WXG100 family type VII secretion target